MSIPSHVVPRQVVDEKAERDRAIYAKQLLLGRYLDPWGTPDIVWCHSHTLVRGLKVILNVYDLLPPRLNGFLAALRLGGAFHSAIQVGTTEYAFGGHPEDDLGITVLKKPLFVLREEAEEAVRRGEDEDGSAAANLEWMPTLRTRTVVGWWMGPPSELEPVLRELRFEECWVGSEYRLLSRNCNHFARAMCAAMLRNPLFKPAPGRGRPDRMVPRSVSRLPALVLALGCCAPCIVRRLNAPIPLTPHSLNVFQGQPRKACPESARLRTRSRTQPQSRGGAGGSRSRNGSAVNPIQVHVNASANAAVAAAVTGAAGVRQSSSSMSSAGLRVGSSVGGGGGGAAAAGGSSVVVVSSGYSLGWPSGAPPPAAATAAAAAAEGRLLRPRLEGRYYSQRMEATALMSSVDQPPSNVDRRCAEDGGGADTPAPRSADCSTPDLAAAAINGTNGAAAAAAANGRANGRNGSQSLHSELALSPPFTSPASAAAAAAPPPAGVQAAAADGASTMSPTATTASALPSGLSHAPPTAGFSVSLLPPVLVMEAGGTATCSSAAAAAATFPTGGAAGAGTGAATPHRALTGPKFLSNSRSGRRVFPDPRVTPPGPECGVGDAAHDSVSAFSNDGGVRGGGGGGSAAAAASRGPAPNGLSPCILSHSDLERGPMAAPAAARDGEAAAAGPGQGSRPNPAPSPCASASPRQGPPPRSLRAQQPQRTPRCSTSGSLPPLALQQTQLLPRLDGSPAKPPQLSPLPLPPSQLNHQHQHPQAPPTSSIQPRSSAQTADGSVAGGSATAGAAASSGGGGGGSAAQLSPEEAPRPWSVLSGGFVDLLFSPAGSSAEPPPGVPHPVAVSGTGSGGGTGTGRGACGGPGGGRRYSSFTGDGTGLFSGASNATAGGVGGVGGLEPVASGDLSGDVPPPVSPHRAAALSARATTGMIGVVVDEAGVVGAGVVGGSGAAGILSTLAPASGMGAAAAAAASPLRPAGAASRGSMRAAGGTMPGLVSVTSAPSHGAAGAAAAAAAAAATAAVAVDNNGTMLVAGRREAF